MWPVIGFYCLNFVMGLDNDSITCDRTYAIIVFNDKFKQTIRLKRALSTLISEIGAYTLRMFCKINSTLISEIGAYTLRMFCKINRIIINIINRLHVFALLVI